MPGGLGFIGWIIIGGLAGWIASKIMGTDEQQGIFLNVVVGVVGAFLGGLILSMVMEVDGMGIIMTFLTAIAGACLLLWIVGMVTGGRRRV
ncbi:MAG: GlsB/YeaQ/YmgE family stress response membrane protein [Actinomycetia bacterium]|nr:GlsB/YeaQ/YmgE family stress response membrane protein [Actinomycetes bacterium]